MRAHRCSLLFKAGRYQEALTALQNALAINPRLEGIHASLGDVLLAEGKTQDALAEMMKEPGEWQRLTGLALTYHALGQPRESDSCDFQFDREAR